MESTTLGTDKEESNIWIYILIVSAMIVLIPVSLCICFWEQIKDCLFTRKTKTLAKESQIMSIKTIDSDTGLPIPSKTSKSDKPQTLYKASEASTSGIQNKGKTSKQMSENKSKSVSVSKSPKEVSPKAHKIEPSTSGMTATVKTSKQMSEKSKNISVSKSPKEVSPKSQKPKK